MIIWRIISYCKKEIQEINLGNSTSYSYRSSYSSSHYTDNNQLYVKRESIHAGCSFRFPLSEQKNRSLC